MSGLLAVGSAFVALFAFATPSATPVNQIAEPPYFTDVPTEQMAIEVLTVNGSGCEPGTAAVAVSADNTAFTVTYSDYLAMVGVGASPTDFRKNCQLNLAVQVPSGFTYAIASVDYRGYAFLEQGATGQQRASYYFQGSPSTAEHSETFTGAMDDNWTVTDVTELPALVWAPCGELRNFNINTELRVSAGTSDPSKTTSFMMMDSTDGEIETEYQLAWRECEPGEGDGD
jgi:hypothetical protein